MGMRDHAVDDYGLLLDDDTIKLLASALFDDFSEEAFAEYGHEFIDGVMEAVDAVSYGSFTGEAPHISDVGEDVWSDDIPSYAEESVYLVPLQRHPTLFQAPYNSVDEIVQEMKDTIGEHLPRDFDYRSNIRHFVGTCG